MAKRRLPQPVFSAGILLALGLVSTGCASLPCLPGGLGNCEPANEVNLITAVDHGTCLPAYGSEIYSADMNKSGSRIIVIDGGKPATLPEDAAWSSSDRALVVYNIGEGGATTSRHIATTWESPDVLLPFATPEDGGEVDPRDGVRLAEEMAEVQMDDAGNRFVVAVNREDVSNGYTKLYTGIVPAQGFANFSPETKDLVLVAVNNLSGVEAIQSFALAPDGNKVAAVVGPQSELRVFDLTAEAEAISVYELNKGGKDVVVGHSLPAPCLGIDCRRTPAVISRGLMRLTWSPDAQQLAIVRTDSAASPGQTTLSLMDVATGKLTKVRSFMDGGSPHVAWAGDGKSMYVMNTPFQNSTESSGPIITDSAFASTLIRQIAAVEGGKDIGAGAVLKREVGWATDPGNLTLFKDGQSLVFVWESRLFRLDMVGGDLSNVLRVYLLDRQKVPDDLKVLGNVVATSPDQDAVLFMIDDQFGRRAALRTTASSNKCPAPEGGAEATAEAPVEAAPPSPTP